MGKTIAHTDRVGRYRRGDIVKISGVSVDQRAVWQDAATHHHMPLATWLREAANASVLTGTTAADLRTELVMLRADLTRGVGNNLNQLARAMHSGGRDSQALSGPGCRAAGCQAALQSATRELVLIRRRTEALLRRVERAGKAAR